MKAVVRALGWDGLVVACASVPVLVALPLTAGSGAWRWLVVVCALDAIYVGMAAFRQS